MEDNNKQQPLSAEEIAQWVIDNRYPKSELQKVSDSEMYHSLVDNIKQQAQRQSNETTEGLLNEIKRLKNLLL